MDKLVSISLNSWFNSCETWRIHKLWCSADISE